MKKNKKQKTSKEQNEFPGYPPYPASEDITINGRRLSIDEEGKAGSEEKLKRLNENPDDDLMDKKSNLTKEDLQALGPRDQSLDEGDDELLRTRNSKVDFSGKDLDVPGSELDDDGEEIGSEDEENNSYSIGGDNHENLEERQD